MSEFDIEAFWQSEAEEHKAVAEKTFETLESDFINLLQNAHKCIKNGGKIILFGNGGSAADAQHLATELTIRYSQDRAAIAAIALTTDTSALTAAGNDIGFKNIFARQIEALGKPEDLAIGISTSGQSPNVLKALEKAKSMNITTAGLSGKNGGKMPPLCDTLLIIPSSTTARIQEMHITLGQMLCGALEQKLGLV